MRLPTHKQWRAYYLTAILQNTQLEAASAMGVSQPMVSRHLAAVGLKLPLLCRESAENITTPLFLSYAATMDYDVQRQF